MRHDYRATRILCLFVLFLAAAPARAWSAGDTAGDSSIPISPSGGAATSLTDRLVYKPLWALTDAIGDFNPIGKHISTPLETCFPGFRFKGFINTITQINTTASSDNAGGFRNKDWRLQKQEFRVQLEGRYQANDNIDFVNINNFYYDGAYDFQRSDGLYRDGSSNQVYYNQGSRIIREAYIRGNYTTVNFIIGKQIVNWGKMDGKVVDFVNAQDSRDVVDFHIGDYEWRAIGQWMALLSLRPIETTTLSLLWNPDFQRNVGPAFGSPYWYPFIPSPPAGIHQRRNVTPSGFDRIKDSELGFRLDNTFGPLTLSGIYYYGFDREPVVFSSDGENHYTRMHRFGYASDYGTTIFGHRLIIRSEGLYSRYKQFNTADPSVANGVVKKDQLKLAVALETSFGAADNRYDLLYQPIWTHNFDFSKLTTQGQRDTVLHVISLSHSVHKTNDRLSLSATFYVQGGNTSGGWEGSYAASWKFNDYLKTTLAFNDYQRHNGQVPWGDYNKYKNVTIDTKYEW